MTTALRVTCRQCGDVEAPIEHGRIVVGVSAREPRATMHFDCPTCGAAGEQRLDERAVRLLLAAGISVVTPSSAPDSVGESHSPG